VSTFDELKTYVGFGDADAARLAAFVPIVRPNISSIIDHFYARAMTSPEAARVIRDEAQLQRLRATLRQWLGELLGGPHDEAYFARRERIGQVHVRVGLDSRFMFVAMSGMRADLCEIAWKALDSEGAHRTCMALGRIMDMDLAIMTGTYIQQREARQLELMQELLVSHLPVTVFLVAADGKVVAATRNASRLFGGGSLVGRHWTRVVPQHVLEQGHLEEHARRALETGRTIHLLRLDVRSLEGTRHYSATLVPIEHEAVRLLVHLEDLTETVETEARLRRSESLAQLGSMSAAVAHELRNPLAGVFGAVQVITRSFGPDDPRAGILTKVEDQIRRLDALVTDLLAFSRPQKVVLVPIDLRAPATAVAELVRREYPHVVVEVRGEGRAGADVVVLERLLLNLVQNAAQAQGGRGRVVIAVGDASIDVSDAGPGVAAEHLDVIFEPFFTTRSRGTGLGLAICRKSAEELGGRLMVQPKGALGGATFTLQLRPVELCI